MNMIVICYNKIRPLFMAGNDLMFLLENFLDKLVKLISCARIPGGLGLVVIASEKHSAMNVVQ